MASTHLPEQAEALKEEGNGHFKAGRFSLAFSSYTTAIGEAPTSAVLYANRSAAAVKMGRYPQALTDAKKACELDPTWHKAHGRLARAHELNDEWAYAATAYRIAASITNNDTEKANYIASANRLVKDNLQAGSLERWDTLCAQRYPFPPDSAVVRFGKTVTNVREAWKDIHDLKMVPEIPSSRPLPPGATVAVAVAGRIGLIAAFVAAVLTDPDHSFILRASETHTTPVELLRHQIRFEMERFRAAPPEASPAQVIRHTEKIFKKSGWGNGENPGARFTLALTIRSVIVNGLVGELIANDYVPAAETYQHASTLIDLARAKWPGKDNENEAGTSIQPSFHRAVKARWLRCLVAQVCKLQNTSLLSEYEPIERLANEILQSCDEYPIVLTPADNVGDIVSWVAFYKVMRAAAHLALGLVFKIRAERDTHKVDGLEYPNRAHLRLSMENYAKAGAWFPTDDSHCAESIWYALDAGIQLGGMNLEEIDEMIGRAQRAEMQCSFFFGRQSYPETNPLRKLVLSTREKMVACRKNTARVSPEKVVLKPIPLRIRANTASGIADFILTKEEYAEAPATAGADGLMQFMIAQDDVVKREAAKGPGMRPIILMDGPSS